MLSRLLPFQKIFSNFSKTRCLTDNFSYLSTSHIKSTFSAPFSINKSITKFFKRFNSENSSDNDKFSQSYKNHINITSALFISCFLVVATMLHGGYTRRESAGLSMTSWNLLSEKYPVSDSEWLEEFEKYKQIPEYILSEQNMTLDEFKHIFNLEFNHRNLGRITGVSVLFLTALLFKYGVRGDKIRGVIYSSMVLGQGLLGWYMVKSGFDPKTMNSQEYPTVSAYRLSAHNILGTLLFSLMFHRFVSGIGFKFINIALNKPLLKISSMLCHFSLLSCLITIGYGGLVSGTHSVLLDAEKYISGDEHDFNVLFSLEPMYRNFFENQVTVQLIHKLLGYVTGLMVAATAFSVFMTVKGPCPRIKLVNSLCVLGVCFQVFFGIYSIITQSDTVRAIHQYGSLQLMSLLLFLGVELSRLKKGSVQHAEKICKSVMNGAAPKAATSRSSTAIPKK